MQLLKEYEASGLQQKDFCERNNLSLSTLQYWLYRKSKKSKPESGSEQRFLPVEVVAYPAPKARETTGPGWIELELPRGVAIRFVVGTDTRYLGELLKVVS
jgi:hypothetical protein